MGNLLKWKVDPAPKGRYRSFDVRAWPDAEFKKSGRPAARLTCVDKQTGHGVEYRPDEVKAGIFKGLFHVFVAQHHPEKDWPKLGGFTWRHCTAQAATLDEAKALAEATLLKFKHFWPEEETNGQTNP